ADKGIAANSSAALRHAKRSAQQRCKTVPCPNCGRTSGTEPLPSQSKRSSHSTAGAAPSPHVNERSSENWQRRHRSSAPDTPKSASLPLKTLVPNTSQNRHPSPTAEPFNQTGSGSATQAACNSRRFPGSVTSAPQGSGAPSLE